MRAKRPITELLNLIGRRWVLRVLWELRQGPVSFRALRERCDRVSPSVLSQRLAELREHKLIDAQDEGYLLSREGRALVGLLEPFDGFAKRWSKKRP